MRPRLSVCIPTYNRGTFLSETLQSVIAQASDEVEITVADNASADETPRVVSEAQAKFPRLKYHRWDKNVGPDRNFLKAVELASGEYAWLLGSDDALEAGTIEYVLGLLKEHPGIAGISLRPVNYSKDLTDRAPAAAACAEDTLFVDAAHCYATLGDRFGYLSAHIFNKAGWDAVVRQQDVSKYFNAYVHIYVYGEMLKANPRWFYSRRPSVAYRSGNDSFMADGRYRRICIKVIGFENISRGLFGTRSAAYRGVQRQIVGRHIPAHIVPSKLKREQGFAWKTLLLCLKFYKSYPIFWWKTAPMLVMPRWMILSLRWVYRRLT